MTQDEVKAVIREVLAEQNQDHDQVVLKTIAAILTSFGIEDEDRKEIRADFIHLRKWRKSVEQAQGYTFKVVITTIVGGVLGAFWLGFQTLLHK
jgi:DUF1009 family protein